MPDTLIFGTNTERVQSKLIQSDETPSQDKAIDIARTEDSNYIAKPQSRIEHSCNK